MTSASRTASRTWSWSCSTARLSKEMLKAGALPLGQVLEFSIQITRGLEEAHEAGIIHRDIKPANIFIVRKQQGAQQAKILDFGLAKQARLVLTAADATSDSTGSRHRAGNSLTIPGSTVGTVAYMSPEQARGEPLDARSDLFSLGSVIYEMATGKLPFAGNGHRRCLRLAAHARSRAAAQAESR